MWTSNDYAVVVSEKKTEKRNKLSVEILFLRIFITLICANLFHLYINFSHCNHIIRFGLLGNKIGTINMFDIILVYMMHGIQRASFITQKWNRPTKIMMGNKWMESSKSAEKMRCIEDFYIEMYTNCDNMAEKSKQMERSELKGIKNLHSFLIILWVQFSMIESLLFPTYALFYFIVWA